MSVRTVVLSSTVAVPLLVLALVVAQLDGLRPFADDSEDQLLVSIRADRSDPEPLHGAWLRGDAHVFAALSDPATIVWVSYYFNGDTDTRIVRTEGPYDLSGAGPDGSARAFDLSSLGSGVHYLEAMVRRTGRLERLRATFTVPAPAQEPHRPAAGAIDPRGDGSPDGLPPDNERLGLHVTSAELDTWRQRAANGPYRVQGDVSSNSPGDWARISEHAATFVEDPDAGRWGGPVANNPGGCVRQADSRDPNLRHTPPYRDATLLRDAAFVALVEQNRRYALAVRDELLAQARVPEVDFTNRARYCLGTIGGDEKPIFNIANWQTRLLYAYDYVRIAYPDLFSAADTALLDRWFAGSAEWMQEAADSRLDDLFVNRAGGDYTLTGTATDWWSRTLYLNGPDARTLQRRYNNRIATAMRLVTLVGVDQANQSFIDSGRRFATEFIRYSYYPNGTFGEFERWTDTRPILGWSYTTLVVGSIITIADVLARTGDTTVYDYTTTDGALGTQGAHHTGVPKSLATMVADLMRYVDHTYTRYGTDDSARAGDDRYLIDSVDELNGDNLVNDTMLTMSNRYYRDPYVSSVYQRTAPGAPGYPANPTHGMGDPEGGEWGTYPGALLMFGDLEHNSSTPFPD